MGIFDLLEEEENGLASQVFDNATQIGRYEAVAQRLYGIKNALDPRNSNQYDMIFTETLIMIVEGLIEDAYVKHGIIQAKFRESPPEPEPEEVSDE